MASELHKCTKIHKTHELCYATKVTTFCIKGVQYSTGNSAWKQNQQYANIYSKY